jgi:hypothetical protein
MLLYQGACGRHALGACCPIPGRRILGALGARAGYSWACWARPGTADGRRPGHARRSPTWGRSAHPKGTAIGRPGRDLGQMGYGYLFTGMYIYPNGCRHALISARFLACFSTGYGEDKFALLSLLFGFRSPMGNTLIPGSFLRRILGPANAQEPYVRLWDYQ